MNKKFRGGLVLASAVAIAMLNGCAFGPPADLLKHDFTQTLSQPRPMALEESVAMKKMYTEFNGYSPRVLGCLIDTAVWEDELPAYKGGFDPLMVFEATIGYHYAGDAAKKELLEPLLKKHGTVPGVIRYGLAEDLGKDALDRFAVNAVEFYDFGWKPDGIHGSYDKFGLGYSAAVALFGTVNESFTRINERLRVKEFTYSVLSYRLTDEEEKYLTSHDMLNVRSKKDVEALTDFYIDKLFSVITETVEEMGYRVAGDRVTWKNPPELAKTYYPLEGNGCPKPNLKEPWNDSCYVGMSAGKYKDGSSWHVSIGRDKKTANLVFDWRYDHNLMNPSHTAEMKQEVYKKMKEIILRNHPNVTFYSPAEEINGVWYPNRVVDKTGTYYFVVPVKRNVKTGEIIKKKI